MRLERRSNRRITNRASFCSSLIPMESTDATTKQDPRDNMFRPPVNRAMRTLDRSFFRKTIPLSAARVFKASDISNVRKALAKSDLLVLPRVNSVREVKEQDGSVLKALLLKGEINVDGKSFGLRRAYYLHGLALTRSRR